MVCMRPGGVDVDKIGKIMLLDQSLEHTLRRW
jgi:hypothetical protein